MSKKGFKAPFTAPSKYGKDKHSGSPADSLQKDAAPSNVARRNKTTKKSTAVSLTDAEYEELFNSVISSVMSMNNSQHSSQNYSSKDKDQTDVPEFKKADSKPLSNATIKNSSHFCKHHFVMTAAMQGHCNHQMQINNQSNNTENAPKESSTYNGVKPKNLFKGVSKKQEHKLMHKTHHCVSNQNPKPSFHTGGQVANVASKCSTTKHISSLHDGDNKENTPPRNKENHQCRPQSAKSHTCSRANTPIHHQTPNSGHLQSLYNRENNEMTHTPCKSHANARTPNTPTTIHSHSLGPYGSDKNDDIPASYHKSTCSHTPCSGHSTGREKSSQISHTYHSLSQSQPMLSQPPPELSLKERLEWLQKRRDVGLWVQCSYSHCSKWRFLHDIHDPVEVPEKWYCHMNSDKNFNSCSAPEKGPTVYEEEDLIHNLYTAGSLVWARLDGYPWWPAMVDDDPDTEQYYWLNGFSDIPTHYNVTFFDEKEVTRAWLTPGALKPFTGMETARQFRKTRVHGVDYSNRIEIAKSMAAEALTLGIGERLRKYSFLSRFKGPFGTLNSKKRGKENYDSDASDDQHSLKKKRFNVTKRKKQPSPIHSSGKTHKEREAGKTHKEREAGKTHKQREPKGETKPSNKKAYKKKETEKICSEKSHKPQSLLSKHMTNYHSEKPINLRETELVNNDKSNSKRADTIHNVQEEGLTQCSITSKVVDDDYEINSSQDLFLSQEKNNPMAEKHINDANITEVTTEFNSQGNNNILAEKQTNNSEEVTNVTEAITDVNGQGKNNSVSEKQLDENKKATNITTTEATTDISSGLKNTPQKNKSPVISQDAGISEEQDKFNSCGYGNNSNKEKLTETEVLDRIVEQAVENTEAAATAECNKSLVAAEPSDAIVPCSQKQASQPGDAVVPNIEESFGLIRNDNDENNHDNHCNDSEDSIDFELEE